jgi:starvation-inducible outer membrane lipoprotein
VTRSFLLALALVAFVLAGCGSSPKQLTKAQYEQELQRLGNELVDSGSQIGQHIDIATFNQDISNFQDELRDASKDLDGVEPPENAQELNDRLADSFDGLADDLEPVKDARRKSIVQAGKAFAVARTSAAAKEGRAVVRQLSRRGYAVGQMVGL